MAPLQAPLKSAVQLFARDDDDGGLKESTKIGIALGLICFFALLLSFYAVANWRKKSTPPTLEEQQYNETLERWINKAPPRPEPPAYTSGERRHRGSTSSCSTLTIPSEYVSRGRCELSLPPPAHLGTHP
ncbi:hypothetical protein EW145_g1741 [Phellinidium pouzarii]|uniref:Uncharacterized protein n=1 Tax=Phellinidium pouzarii TaxID=167371 RepID=A0A4S4LF55_9AGAM|nr:hypothetical protein EW145_g1741 [Phellinidium pouzarii]